VKEIYGTDHLRSDLQMSELEYTKVVNNQITLPMEVLEKANLHDGDYLEVDFTDGKITLIPFKISDCEDESWLDDAEWQERMKEAEKDVKAGRLIGPFDNAEDLLKSLKAK